MKRVFEDDTAGYKRLIASVIWLAISDSCVAPVKRISKNNRYFPQDKAFSAVRFLFEDNMGSYYRKYIECLGLDPETFRNKILRLMYAQKEFDDLPKHGLPLHARKNFRFNHTYWLTKQLNKGKLHAAFKQNRRNLTPSILEHLNDILEPGDNSDPSSTREDLSAQLRHRD